MKARGRPPYPDILTPRQWEVLALLRQGLTNEEIADRLGISLDGAKFHVSDIIHKLGVDSRYEAAAWQPAAPTWLQRTTSIALAPASVVRRLHWNAFTYAASAAVVTVVIVGIALLAWGVSRTRGDGTGRLIAPSELSPNAASTCPFTPTRDEGFPCARETLIAAATAGLVPEGLLISTATPDLRQALSPDQVDRTLRSAGFGQVLDTVQQNDSSALLAEFDFKPSACGGRADDGCGDSPPGTLLPKINTGTVTFYVSAETVLPYLRFLMTGEPLQLMFVSRSTSHPERYVLGFAGPQKGLGFPPLASNDSQLSAIFFVVDTGAPHPVQHFDVWGPPTMMAAGLPTPTNRACEATRFVYDTLYHDADQVLLLFDPC